MSDDSISGSHRTGCLAVCLLLVVYKIYSCRPFWFFACVDYGNRFLSCPGTVINDRMMFPFKASGFIHTIGSH